MKSVQVNVLGFSLPFNWYESVAESDKAGGEGSTLREANTNLQYRGASAEARGIICVVLASLAGLSRVAEPILDKDGKPTKNKKGEPATKITEKESTFIDRCLAKLKQTKEQVSSAVTKAITAANEGKGVSVDITQTERKESGPKKLPEKFLTNVRVIMGTPKLRGFSDAYAKLLGKPLPKDADEVQLGWCMKEYSEEVLAQTMKF